MADQPPLSIPRGEFFTVRPSRIWSSEIFRARDALPRQ